MNETIIDKFLGDSEYRNWIGQMWQGRSWGSNFERCMIKFKKYCRLYIIWSISYFQRVIWNCSKGAWMAFELWFCVGIWNKLAWKMELIVFDWSDPQTGKT
jgi:hypothetical protein